MADQPEGGIEIGEFAGLMTNADPNDLPPENSQVQTNVQSLVPGRLDVRLGVVQQASLTPAGSGDIITLYTYVAPDGDWVVTVHSNGDIKATRDSGTKTLATGVNVTMPWTFSTVRNGDLIGVNGYQRGIRWDGFTSSAEDLGIKEPVAAPTVSHPGGGAATAGDYACAYRFLDNTLPNPSVSGISTITTVAVAANDQFSWSDIDSSADSRVTHLELWRSTSGAPNVLYFITKLAIGVTSYSSDTSSDQTLIDNSVADASKKLVVLAPSGTVVADRAQPPPFTKPFVAQFQDRAFYAGYPNFTQGTVTTNGSTTVTGADTGWNADMAGRYMWIDTEPRPVLISTVAGSGTSLTLDTAATTSTSGLSYNMLPSAYERNQILYSYQDEPESVHSTFEVIVQENTKATDTITGLLAFGSLLYIGMYKHIYTLSFFVQPRIDVDIRLLAHRGLVNNRCWDVHEGVVYAIDRAGIYKMSAGGSITPISAAIQDIFRKDSSPLDWANQEWWFCVIDYQYELVRFHVGYTEDETTRPKRALVYGIRSEAWWLETYNYEMGDGARFTSDGQPRVALGGEDRRVFFTNESATDTGGPCAWTWKTGVHRWVSTEQNNVRRLEVLAGPNTAGSIALKTYSNRSATATDWGVTVSSAAGEGVATTSGNSSATIDNTRSTGYFQVRMDGLRQGAREVDRFIELELSGTQKPTAQTISQVLITGVE